MSVPRSAKKLGPLDRMLDSRLIAALTSPRHVDAYLELVDPLWSIRECRAAVVSVRRETTDMVTLELAPNARFPSHRAGEWLTLTPTIDGSRVSRCFSIASAPSAKGPIELTIRVREEGVVSRWAGHDAKRGDIVLLGMPQGEFVLPEALPESVLLVSGGSGITPCISILRDIVARALPVRVTFLHFARTYADVPFLDELRAIAEKAPNVTLGFSLTREPPTGADLAGHVTPAMLDAFEARASSVPAEHVYVCGPNGLVDAVASHYAALTEDGRLHIERFTAPVRTTDSDLPGADAPRRVGFMKSGVIATSEGKRSLLLEAEAAGLSPAHGCRMGICQTCRCTKTAGVVRDQITGELLDESVTDIRICISTAVTDITLDL